MSLTREQIQAVDEIDVVIKWGSGGAAQERVRRAEVLEVARAAARVRFIDGKREERLIRFNDLRLVPVHVAMPKGGGSAATAAPARPVLVVPPPLPVTPAAAPPVTVPTPVAATSPTKQAEPPKPASDEFEAWLQLGRETFLDPLEAEIGSLRLHKEALEAEREAIDAELETIGPRLQELHARRERIAAATSMVKANGPGVPAAVRGKV